MTTAALSIPASETICETIDLVTTVSLGLRAIPVAPPDYATWAGRDTPWTSCVSITGGFHGAVTVSCTRPFVVRAAQTMFETEEVDDESARDVLSELTNIIGGNLKSLLVHESGTPASLGVPMLAIGKVHLQDATSTREQWCDVGGNLIVVTVMEARHGRVDLRVVHESR